MNYKKTAVLKPQNTKINIIFKVIATALIVAILGGLYLKFAWNRYQNMAESEALQLAQSVKSLLHVDHILALGPNEETQPGSAADFPIPSPTQASCEETVEINRIPFET